ncbi:expressed unknown protein [Seminavis robusta]|uniref:Uncharacterized protein n=1 Tax=Seminavis robusta TaxID=568900 RepID=A0A9N8EHC2_9STRA|nr:expressed unknown protein [Seminavis robusta]|eukprot:Sro938_g222320.1 n/a (440) ;mRNA; r:25022-26443
MKEGGYGKVFIRLLLISGTFWLFLRNQSLRRNLKSSESNWKTSDDTGTDRYFPLGAINDPSGQDGRKIPALSAAHRRDPSATNEESHSQSSKHATVMGMATGYSLRSYKSFVGSLRATGYQGHIILVVSQQLEPSVEDYLTSQNVTMKPLISVNCTHGTKGMNTLVPKNEHEKERTTCAHPYPDLKIRWGRFALLRDYLEECQQCTGPVLVTDVRDTFFQRDPFGPEASPVKGLQVFEEDPEQRTHHPICKRQIEKCKKMEIPNEVMLCSGTTIGTRDAMLSYLNIMVQEMMEWMKSPDCCCNYMSGDDQTIHNYLYYTGKIPQAIPHSVAIPNGQGLVHTVGKYGAKVLKAKRDYYKGLGLDGRHALENPYTTIQEEKDGNWLGNNWLSSMDLTIPLTDVQGYFVNSKGERSFVVHQYDRFGSPMNRWLYDTGPCRGL